MKKTFNLVLIRHGESLWNKSNKFTGLSDIILSNKGLIQANTLGRKLKEKNIKVDYIFTSTLKRAKTTAYIINDHLDINKTIKSYRLNERSYGSLEGLSKDYIKLKYTKEYLLFKNNLINKPLIRSIPENNNKSESILNTMHRFKPLWENKILKILKNNKKIIIISHKNQIKSILLFFNLDPYIDVNNCDPLYINYNNNTFQLVTV